MITFLFYYFLIAIFIGLFFIHTLDNIKIYFLKMNIGR